MKKGKNGYLFLGIAKKYISPPITAIRSTTRPRNAMPSIWPVSAGWAVGAATGAAGAFGDGGVTLGNVQLNGSSLAGAGAGCAGVVGLIGCVGVSGTVTFVTFVVDGASLPPPDAPPPLPVPLLPLLPPAPAAAVLV